MKIPNKKRFSGLAAFCIALAAGLGAMPVQAGLFDDVPVLGDVENGVRNGMRELDQGRRNIQREILDARLSDIPNIPSKAIREGRAGLRNFDEERRRAQAHLLDNGLGEWIMQSRWHALQRGTSPIPPHIYQRLARYFPVDLLNRISWRAGPGEAWSLQSGAFNHGGAQAITLYDVIVFNTPADANDDVLWAHEVHHVAQYFNWGVKNFAYHYLRERGNVEREAEHWAHQYALFTYGGG